MYGGFRVLKRYNFFVKWTTYQNLVDSNVNDDDFFKGINDEDSMTDYRQSEVRDSVRDSRQETREHGVKREIELRQVKAQMVFIA